MENNDQIFGKVVEMYKAGLSMRTIYKDLHISQQKVRKILITAGLYETEESKLLDSGMTVEEILHRTDKTDNAVYGLLPYVSGIHDADLPEDTSASATAERIKQRKIARLRKQIAELEAEIAELEK